MCVFLYNTTTLLINICSEIVQLLYYFNILYFDFLALFNHHFKGKYRKIKRLFLSSNFLQIQTCNEDKSLNEFIHTCFTSRTNKSISTRTSILRQASSSMFTWWVTVHCKNKTREKKIQFKYYILCGYEHSTCYDFPIPFY